MLSSSYSEAARANELPLAVKELKENERLLASGGLEIAGFGEGCPYTAAGLEEFIFNEEKMLKLAERFLQPLLLENQAVRKKALCAGRVVWLKVGASSARKHNPQIPCLPAVLLEPASLIVGDTTQQKTAGNKEKLRFPALLLLHELPQFLQKGNLDPTEDLAGGGYVANGFGFMELPWNNDYPHCCVVDASLAELVGVSELVLGEGGEGEAMELAVAASVCSFEMQVEGGVFGEKVGLEREVVQNGAFDEENEEALVAASGEPILLPATLKRFTKKASIAKKLCDPATVDPLRALAKSLRQNCSPASPTSTALKLLPITSIPKLNLSLDQHDGLAKLQNTFTSDKQPPNFRTHALFATHYALTAKKLEVVEGNAVLTHKLSEESLYLVSQLDAMARVLETLGYIEVLPWS